MASKRVIVLEQRVVSPATTQFRVALWADVPVARQTHHADASKTSAYKLASAQEVQDLKDGKVLEKVEVVTRVQNMTLAQLRAAVEALWTAWQAEVTADNTYERYGSHWAGDGSSWTNAGA
jgi:hypothetical protein